MCYLIKIIRFILVCYLALEFIWSGMILKLIIALWEEWPVFLKKPQWGKRFFGFNNFHYLYIKKMILKPKKI